MITSRVRDHNHYTGEFRGIAHNKCNLLLKKSKFIPVFFHNLGGYDERLFLRELGNSPGYVKCIAKNEENFITLSKDVVVGEYIDNMDKVNNITRTVRFLDTMKFMNSTLANLVENLDPAKFHILKKEFPDKAQRDLLTRKCVYPYDYMNSMDKLNETSLPPRTAFYSKLTDEHISKEDHEHAKKVWKVFNCKTMRDYHNLYVKTDVVFLSDVFEAFRNMSMETYGLDPTHYATAPGLAGDAALKKTKVELELFTEDQSEMFLMVESGIRGGISTVTHRHAVANNKYMKVYDPKKKSSFIMYLDANNLYGWAMSKPLPTGGFKWMGSHELLSWEVISNTKGKGCVLEVDLENPKHLHDKHNFLPLAPERVEANGVKKLIPNLNNKTRYMVHHEALKTYLKYGLRITKIHKGVMFDESPWLKSYIDMNIGTRANVKNEFEKDFFKLMNNSVFGKTMENIRKRVNIEVANNDNFKKLVQKVTFNGRKVLSENMSLVHLRRLEMKMNKPMYVGQAILNISKILMYEFHYGYFMRKFPNAKLVFTDTDSLCYHVETEDIYMYKDIAGDVETMFDTCNYPKNHSSGIPTGKNMKIIGMMKDEVSGKQIEEIVALRAKLYIYL